MINQKNSLLLVLLFCFSCSQYDNSSALLVQAEEYVQAANYKKALESFNKSLDRGVSPTLRSKIILKKAEIYHLYIQDNMKALEEYQKLIDDEYDIVWRVFAIDRMADIYFDFENDYKSSAEQYKILISFLPKLEKYNFYLFRYGLSLFKSKQYEKASEIFEQIAKDKDNTYHNAATLERGLVDYVQAKYQKSIDYWKENKDLVKGSEYVDIIFYMASAYEHLENLDKAYSLFFSLKSVYPDIKIIEAKLDAIYKRRINGRR